MPTAATRVLPQAARFIKTISTRRILTGLMRSAIFRGLGFSGALGVLVVSVFVFCGSTRLAFAADAPRVGLPWDWSHEHVVFGKTDDPEIMAIIRKDPRAFHQWLRRNPTAAQSAMDGVPISFDSFMQSNDTPFGSATPESGPDSQPRSRRVKHKRDWGVSLGATHFNGVNATNVAPLYPAKYTFDINATPSCLNDYAVFPTGANGKTSTNVMTPNGQASIVGYNYLYSTQGSVGGFCNNNGPKVAWSYVNVACPGTMNNDPILSSPVISLDGTKVAWVTSAGKVQIVTIGAGGGSVLAPLCIGSVASGGDGAVLQTLALANAKHNPTSGVSVSAIFVDYNSDSAYVGDDDGFLHKISPFFTTSGALQETATAGWLPSHSYSINTVIVDSNGFIEKCTTAGTSGSGGHPGWSSTWNATTTDNTVTWTNIGSGGGWPVYVTGSSTHADSSKLNGPIFDFVSKNIFVGDQNGSLFYVLDPGSSTAVGSCANGAVLYPCLGKPGTTTGIATGGGPQMDCSSASPGPTCLVMSSHQGFTDPLVVDISNKVVITQFSNADGSNAKVEQTNTSLSVFNSVNLAAQANISSHTGAFDNNYYSSPATGYYYVCGPNGNVTDLYRVGFTNTLGTVALASSVNGSLKITTSGSSGNCSPLTEIYNTSGSTAHDWLFLSVDNHGTTPICNDGSCVMSFSLVSTMVTGVQASYGSGMAGNIANMNGTGGMIVDNEAGLTYGQASSIYFMPVASNLTCGDGTSNTGCAVKLTQAGLN